jgi:flagellar biosynthetic protein FlhB
MAEEGEDPESKTEEPTQRRLDEALEKGQIVNSREVTSFFMILVLSMLAAWVLPYTYNSTGLMLKSFIENAHDIDISEKGFKTLMRALLAKTFAYSVIPLFALTLAAIFASFAQQGQINVSAEPLIPELSRISPFAGFKRIFSVRSLVEFLKGILKITVMFTCLYLYIVSNIDTLEFYQHIELSTLLSKTQELINQILMMVCIMMAVLAAADYFYQRYEYYKSLRMTKEEIKQEYKQSEGNPEVKQKMRSLGRERVKGGLTSVIPKADVIITNPTHYSIALQYNSTMPAPKLIAKGQDFIALKIRELAKENDIPLVENKELARALYDNVEVDEEIPVEYYEAVAQIISYIYKLKGKR